MKNKKMKNMNGELMNGGTVESPVRAQMNSGCENEYDTPDPLSPTRNGKIARLDRDTREALNRQIQKGYSGADILAWLNAEPKVKAVLDKEFEGQPIGTQNLSQWRHGGYDEWQKHQLAYVRLAKKQGKSGNKSANPHQLGAEMAQLYAEELTVTLDDLLVTAPTAEERMKRLDKGLARIQGWRWADYHAERMALEQKKWAWQCQKEIHAQEAAEEQKEIKRLTKTLIRSHLRNFGEPGWIDLLMDGQSDVDILYALEGLAWKIQANKARKKALEKEAAGKAPSSELKKDESEVLEVQGTQKSTKARQSGDTLSPESKVQGPEEIQTTNIQPPIPHGAGNIQHPVEGGKGDEEKGVEDTPEAEVQSPKSGEVEAKVQHSPFNVQPSEADSDSEMSSEERREMGARALEMLYDLFHGGEDILAIESHDELLEKHAALKAKKEEIPDTNNQTLDNNQTSSTNVESLNSGIVESGNGKPQSDALRSDAGGGTPALPEPTNLQPSTCNLQPSIDGPMTFEQANKAVDEWYQKARRLGGIVVNSWDVADLRAYLSQQPAAYYSLKTGKHEFRQPPARDPRYDPASPWSRAWPYLEAEMRANEKN